MASYNVIAGRRSDGTPSDLLVSEGGALAFSGNFAIPSYDHMALTYYSNTNNIATQVFKRGGALGTTVATLTYTYTGGGAADDDRIASITIS